MYFVDRKKSIIRRSGENISSLEVEAVISQLPGVQAVGAVPVPDEIRGEEVFVAIVKSPTQAADAAFAGEICRAVMDRLTYYKAPGYVAFLENLPLTASQKLQRGELKAMARQLVEAGDVFDIRSMKKKPAKRPAEKPPEKPTEKADQG